MTKLKPCPFCGGTVVDVANEEYATRIYYYVVCNYSKGGCGANGGVCTTETEAIEAWNRRDGEDERKSSK